MNSRKTVSLIILFLALLALPIVGRYATYYGGVARRPEVPRPELDKIAVPTPPAAQYSDEVIRAGQGSVVVDLAHRNQVQLPELNVLAGRLAARGHRLVSWEDGRLQDVLREASAFVVAVPLQLYDQDEIEAVKSFVASGGRLLLIGDPTRFYYLTDDWGWVIGIDSDARYLDSLGTLFGISFVDDYLYNVTDNEGNFRNIKLSRWGPAGEESALTTDLDTVVFYAAHSLAVADEAAVVVADDDTWSSATDRAGGLVVAAEAAEGRVLALGDLTFMTEPYHTVRDNSRLIAHIADWLTGAERSYDLFDFPLVFGQKVALSFVNNPRLGPGQLQLVDRLQEQFDETDRRLVLVDTPDGRTDAILVGLYSQADPISDTLSSLGVTLIYTPAQTVEDEEPAEVEETLAETTEETGEEVEDEEATPEPTSEPPEPDGLVAIEALGSYGMSGTALILYDQAGDRQVLTLLAASQQGLGSLIDRLLERDLLDCVLADAVTLCPTGVEAEPIEESWEATEAAPEATPTPAGEEPPAAEGGEIEYGETVSGELEEAEADQWRFGGSEGDVITVRAQPDDEMDLVLELLDANGETLTTTDDGLSGEEEVIRGYELPATADYTIQVSDYWEEAGTYTLTLELGGGEDQVSGGVIALGETVESGLGQDEQAVWSFSAAADQSVAIILQPGEEGDMTLALQDEDGNELARSDDGYTGEEERIEGRLPADGTYRILVTEYYGEPVSYTLTLEAGEGGPVLGGWGVLIISADDGTATTEGRTGADVFERLLSPDYDVTVWTISDDGVPDAGDVSGYQLVIWSSGDYQGGDASVLFEVLLEGGSLLISGAFPGLTEADTVAVIRDVEVADSDTILTEGFAPGEVIELVDEIEAMVFEGEDDEGTIPLFLRGPASEEAGVIAAAAVEGDEFFPLRLMLIGFPIYLLPGPAQEQLIANAMEWYQVSPAGG